MRRVCQNRREVEKAFFIFGAFRTFAPHQNFRSSLYCVLDLRLNLLTLYFRMHRAEPRVFVQTIADLESLYFSGELLDKLAVDALDNVQALDGETRLPAIVEAAH